MRGVSGNLLIGGMTLRDLQCYIEPESGARCQVWSGRLAVSPTRREALEIGRPYRLELYDGRAGQVVVKEMRVEPGHEREELVLEVEGLSALE